MLNTYDEMIELIKARKERKVIEFRKKRCQGLDLDERDDGDYIFSPELENICWSWSEWRVSVNRSFNFIAFQYRIQPLLDQ